MGYVFICRKCGDIKSIDLKFGTRYLKCNKCAKPMDWSNAFPPQSVIDFRDTVDSLFELSKKRDKEILNARYDFVKSNHPNFDKTQLDKYINQYEKICEKYPDNDDTLWQSISDEFEYEIRNDITDEQSTTIKVVMDMYPRNQFRKAYIIMLASLIEQLFNDYFTELINCKFSSFGSEVCLAKYNTAGIQSVIDITDSFLDEPLKKQMDKFLNGFFDRWASLRNLRNSIIHSNNKYITKIKISTVNKLIEESYTVFAQLKSNLYKEKD